MENVSQRDVKWDGMKNTYKRCGSKLEREEIFLKWSGNLKLTFTALCEKYGK